MDHQIKHVKAADKDGGSSFGIVGHDKLVKNNEIFQPTMRDFHVIFWFREGRGTYYVDFQKYTFGAGTVIFLAKDQISYFDRFEEDVVLQSIVFTPDFIYRSDSDLKHLFQFSMSDHVQGLQIIKLSESAIHQLDTISENMKAVYDGWMGEARSNAFYHWLSLFLITCEQLQSQRIDGSPIDEQQKHFLQFNQLLEANFKKEFKVDYYLQEMGVSVKVLSKLTKEKFKLSPKAVIDERRMLEIKRLLKGTTEPTKNIAYEMGFDEPTNMVKYFKKKVGLTPSAFRET